MGKRNEAVESAKSQPNTVPASATTPCPPARPPTAAELQSNPVVQRAMEQAWNDSQPNDATHRHEEGGWIYMDTATGAISVRRTPAGSRAGLSFANPPEVPGSTVVGTFHTHPNPTSEGWEPGPSETDIQNSANTGVPWLIRADDGTHTTGPDSRRGGLGGGAGFPP